MAKGYSKADFISSIDKASKDMATFYQQDFVNYVGKTTDTKELYTEIVAEWLLNHLDVLKQIPTIDREKGYFVETHDGSTNAATSNRAEERIAMSLFRRKSFQSIGEIIDYQTPLKNKQRNTAGKIDLLSYDGKVVRILELKKPDCMDFNANNMLQHSAKPSTPETMLRCVLEGYTYLHTIADQNRFIKSFVQIKADAILKTSPLVFKGSTQWSQMNNPEYKYLHQLMQILDVQPFYITGDCESNFDIVP